MKYTFIIFFIILYSISFSQSSVWKAEKVGNIMYFASDFGRIARSDYPLPSEYYKASNAADILVLDYNFIKSKKDTLTLDSNKLKASTSEAELNQLLAIAKKIDIKYDDLKSFSKYDALSFLRSKNYTKMGLDGASIEYSFFRSAEKSGKKVVFLSDQKTIMSHYENIPIAVQEQSFKYSLERFSNMKKTYKDYRKNWLKGDTKEIEAWIMKQKNEFPDNYNYNFVENTNLFYPKILELLKNDQVEFVLLSRLNFLGPDGIFKRLENEGFNIEQLKF